MENRFIYVDEMKGLAILFVCMGHLLGPHSVLGNLQPTLIIIASFHMAFFFFLSGYINQKTHKIESKGVGTFVRKRINSLLIPHLFWLYLAPYFLYDTIPSSWNEAIGKLNFYPNVNEWFLPCLFIAIMFWMIQYIIMEKYFNSWKYKQIIHLSSPAVLAIAGLVFNMYFLVIYAIYMGCFIFGDILSGSKDLQKFFMQRKVWAVSAIILCISWKFYTPELAGGMIYTLVKLLLYAICSFGACVFFYNIFRQISIPKMISIPLQTWGKMSLVIYLLPIYLLPKDFIFPVNWTNTEINLFVLVIGILQCSIGAGIGELVMKIPGLSFIMFRKK